MSPTTTVPVSVTPEAQERVNELGFQAEMERMIEYARQVVPQLTRIDVERFERYDEDSPDAVRITATMAKPWRRTDSELETQLSYWCVTTFPPEVLEHLLLDVRPLTIDYER